jgi:hypothetical protein
MGERGASIQKAGDVVGRDMEDDGFISKGTRGVRYGKTGGE